MSHVDDGTLHAYLDGELTPAEAQGVDAHVAQCPICRNRLDEERALIARADELLGLAAPPERALPPFRPGDLKPPARLWWQVRLPLAWAATLVVALGVGTFVGSRMTGRLAAPLATDRLERSTPIAAQPPAETALAKLAPRRLAQPTRSVIPPTPAAEYSDAGAKAAAERQRVKDEALRMEAQHQLAAREQEVRAALPAAAAPPAPAPAPSAIVIDGGYVVSTPPLTLDSARALLGTDPLAVPGLPITSIHRARLIGYTAIVVIEQALDSGKTIAVINGRASPLTLGQVVVTAVGEADTPSPGELAVRGRSAARRPDSLAAVARKANAAPPPAPAVKAKPTAAGLFLDVRGALSADSLAALRRRLQPLRP